MTELDLEQLAADCEEAMVQQNNRDYQQGLPLVQEFTDDHSLSTRSSTDGRNLIEDPTDGFLALKKNSSFHLFQGNTPLLPADNETRPGQQENYNSIVSHVPQRHSFSHVGSSSQRMRAITKSMASHYETDSVWQTVKSILDRTLFCPPVVGALLGIFCAVTPLRGVFVDLTTRHR